MFIKLENDTAINFLNEFISLINLWNILSFSLESFIKTQMTVKYYQQGVSVPKCDADACRR